MREDKGLIIFALPGNEEFARRLIAFSGAETGEAEFRSFPDGESYVRVLSDVKDKTAIAVCSLHHPNDQILPLYFLGKTAKSLGAKHFSLIAPYLAYMRQDKVFRKGEAVTSGHFAKLICAFADSIATVDPHLHRRRSLSEIYPVANETIHAATSISGWIKENLERPVLIGPDEESGQWVRKVAEQSSAPFTVLEKTRRGDRDVSVSVPKIEEYRDHTPVLVDDIISTARTMIETVGHLKNSEMKPPVCVGVHAVFAGNAYRDLLAAGARRVVTCNTIPHATNEIDVSDLFTEFLGRLGEL
jgi:ribose-phosphate pyrophosphokinase